MKSAFKHCNNNFKLTGKFVKGFVPVVGSVGCVGCLEVEQPGCAHDTAGLLCLFFFRLSLSAEPSCDANPTISWHMIRCL